MGHFRGIWIGVHIHPLWRERADSLIYAVARNDPSEPPRLEQLWARRISETCYEICCIPMFAYNIDIGDLVQAKPLKGHIHIIQDIIRFSSWYNLRIYFGDSPLDIRERTIDMLSKLKGMFLEWGGPNLLAVSTKSAERVRQLVSFLNSYEQQGLLAYETGWQEPYIIETGEADRIKSALPEDIFVHLHPVWKEKINYSLHIPFVDARSRHVYWEQLWVKHLGNDVYEICCVPFYIYDLALGDVVHLKPVNNHEHLVLAQSSGHRTARIRLKQIEAEETRRQIFLFLEQHGCLYEWDSEQLIAVDIPSESVWFKVQMFLEEEAACGLIDYEQGWLV